MTVAVAVRVRAPSGTREFPESELPLVLGSGAAAQLPLADPSLPARAAFLGRRAGRYYLQAAPGVTGVSVDGEPIDGGARWLAVGDRIRIGSDRLAVEQAGDELVLVAEGLEEAVTEPPVLLEAEPVAAAAEGDEAIQPVAFRRTLQSLREPDSRRSAWRHAVWLPAAVLAAIAWFIFTAQPVRVVVQPAPQSLNVEGGLLSPGVGERFLLRPGRYTARAELAGYEPLAEAFEVTDEGPDTVTFRLVRLPDRYTVTSRPVDGATVYVDGKSRGTTPLEDLELRRGTHTLRVDADRYLPWDTEVRVEGGGNERALAAELMPNWGDVTVASTPPRAQVSADGRELGYTPLTVPLEAGSYELELTKSGHKPWRDRISVEANQALEVPEVTLEQADGRLRVSTEPAGASVLVDGRYRGQTPLDVYVAPDDAHRVELRRAGYETVQRSASVPSGASRTLELTLTPVLGDVQVVLSPADSVIRVDGRVVTPQDGRLRLPAIEQRLEVTKPGYAGQTVSVTPKPGVTQRVEVTLQTEAEARTAALEPRIRTPQGAELVLVQPGRFSMGSSRREPGRRANETMREIEITKHYYIGVHEVTNAQFREFDAKHYSGDAGGYELNGDRHPVVRVSWEQAAAYCNWLSERAGLQPAYRKEGDRYVLADPPTGGYRLPTETEWVWAARYAGTAGTAKRYAWGDSLPPAEGAGNYADKAAEPVLGAVINNYEDGFPVSAPVASFAPNALGLYDAGGNVSEWVQDYYGVAAPPGGRETDPRGAASGQFRVIRGASWMHYGITELRMTYRDYGDKPRADLGFRIARSAL